MPFRFHQKQSYALAHPSLNQLLAALVHRFYQFFTLRDGLLMSCFQMETVCFKLFLRRYLQYSLCVLHYESCWLPLSSPIRGFLKGCNGTLKSRCARRRKASTLALRLNYRLLHHFSKFIYTCFTNAVKSEAGNGCGTSRTTRTSSMLSTSPKLLVTFTSRYSTMKQDLILIS